MTRTDLSPERAWETATPAAPATAGELLELVRTGRAATRAELRALTGLSRTAVTARVGVLTAAGLLVHGEELASTGGRPPGALLFNRDAGVVLAVAVGRSRSQLAVLDLEGHELASDSRDHESGVGPDTLLPDVVDRLRGLLEGLRSGPAGADRPVLGIGLSLPGTVDPERGVSVGSPVMAGWDGVELAPWFEGLTDAPLFVANDADVLARSELLGGAGVLPDALVVKASTGLGLGIVADGHVLSGHLGAAGEIGHTVVDVTDGLPCRCGGRGCLETVAGGWALVARMAELRAAEGAAGSDASGASGASGGSDGSGGSGGSGGSRPEVEHVRDLVALALQGDAAARGLLRESGRALGEVLAVAINLLNPAAVVIGGDMAAAFDFYVAGVRESVYRRAAPIATRDLRFLPAAHGDRAGVVGCGALALDHVLAPAAVDARLAAR